MNKVVASLTMRRVFSHDIVSQVLMTLFDQSSEITGRPHGVVAIAIAYAAFAVVALAIAALTSTGRVPLAAGAFLVGGEMETAGPRLFLLVALFFGIASLGLLKQKNWARHLAIGLAFVGLVQVTPAISSAVADGRIAAIFREGLQIIFRVIIIWYLMQEPVRDTFR